MSKASCKLKNGKVVIGIDVNEDGENSILISLPMNEAISEAISRGKAIEGVKVTSLQFKGTSLLLVLDTDQDGEPMLEMTIDLGEVFDEVKDKILQ